MFISQEELSGALGDSLTNEVVARLRRLAQVPQLQLQILSRAALSEMWGENDYALEKYLAVHLAWSIEQERYTVSQNQLFLTAGHLQTRYGTPVYLVFEKT